MKLKNFIKKPKKKEVKEQKTFNLHKKLKNTQRIEKKTNLKKNRIVYVSTIFSLILFTSAVIIFILGLFYNYVLEKKISSNEIISPGSQNVIEISEARRIILDKGINIRSFEYSSSSGALTLVIDNDSTVYFSDQIDFLKQVELLDKIIYSLKAEDKKAKIIDLRYNRPIVKF